MKSISVVIPTFNRGKVLLDTIDFLIAQSVQAHEIIIVDQTIYIDGCSTHKRLTELDQDGVITWVRREEPSIPKAMNHGLLLANSEYVLFLDDDINIDPLFLKAHRDTLNQHDCPAQVGQVLQPSQMPRRLPENYQSNRGVNADMEFVFSSNRAMYIKNCMAGNLCVHRALAIAIGGFDENFVGAAYRFETEFCRRLTRHTNKPFYFFTDAVLHHLQYASGGTRNVGHQLITSSAHHSVGDYYYAMLESNGLECLTYCVKRFILSIKARFYLARPWYIPIRLLAEIRGYRLAKRLKGQGPKLLSRKQLDRDVL